jgi:hypothetical protein
MTATKSNNKTSARKAPAAKRSASPTAADGVTTAGLARMSDEATVAWIIANRGDETRVGTLHRQFRAAGYGANLKRFGRLVERAVAAEAAEADKVTPIKRARGKRAS